MWIVLILVAACDSDSSKDEPAHSGAKDASSSAGDAATAADSGRSTAPGSKDASTAGRGAAASGGSSGTSAGTSAPQRDAGAPTDGGKPSEPGATDASGTSEDDAMAAGDAAVPETCTGKMKLDAFVSDPKLCVYVFASNVSGARGIAFAPNGDLFVNNGDVIALWDENHDGTSDSNERSTFGSAPGLNHGIVFSPDGKFLYASSPTTVYRWPYASGQRSGQNPQVVIQGIPNGGHATRTLAFDSQARLIVSIGSAGNVDTNQSEWETRAQIRRYVIPATLPSQGLEYLSGEVIASGMRNEVGIFVDTDDRLWGVENGRDNLSDPELGGDIHNDNPGEEINLVDGEEPKFYGYPFCFSEFAVSSGGGGPGTQWADQTLDPSIQKTDAFCRDTTQVRAPVWVMPPHWAPLGIIRYRGRALPMAGDLIIGAHGSWNREPATGRVVARARVEGSKVTALDVIVGEKDGSGKLRQGTWNVRPVDVRQGPDDAVYVSDDLGGRVLKIGYAR
jgi:glucose/arabinose dehydrogenase